MPKITIDNREIEVPSGTKVIDAAERLGIVIPRFCYHPALGSVGACRVCAVAFKEGPVRGVQMSCMIDALDGMVVSTTDAEAVDFRRHVIELLMLNHPHDCPVCDEGGHCQLQDMTVAGGHGLRRYRGLKRTHRNQELGPLVQHEMNRCIQCYRCSRYYQEFTGYRDLGVMGIGSRVYFGRAASGVLESPFAGNLIDVCPTGVYTDKPSRFIGRRWDFQRQPSVCLHCSLGCNLTVSARYREVVRHEARPNSDVNGHFICDRGRYGYAYASAADRPRQALASGKTASMDAVISAAREAIPRDGDRGGSAGVAVVASPRCSLETLAVIKQACRRHGWVGPAAVLNNRQAVNLRTAIGRLTPELAVSLAAVANADEVLVIGADPICEAPMLALSLRQVQRRGGRVTVIDPRGVKLPFDFDHWAVHPGMMGDILRSMTQRVGDSNADVSGPAAPSGEADAFPVAALAKHLNSSPRPVIICGTDIVTPAEIELAADLADALRQTHIKVGLFYTLAGANAFAAALTDEAPLSLEQVLDRIEAGTVRVLVAVEANLLRTFPDRARLQTTLKRLDHLVVLDYVDDALICDADYFIPTQPIYESGGHWINQEGRVQAAAAVMAGGEPIAMTGGLDHPPRVFGSRIPGGEPVAAWRAVTALAGNADGEDDAAEALQAALRAFHPAAVMPLAGAGGRRIDLGKLAASPDGTGDTSASTAATSSTGAIMLLLVDRTFGTEPLSAMAPALNAIESEPSGSMHPETMDRLGLAAGRPVTVSVNGSRLTLPVQADPEMAREVLVIPRHHLLDWQMVGETRVAVDSTKLKAES